MSPQSSGHSHTTSTFAVQLFLLYDQLFGFAKRGSFVASCLLPWRISCEDRLTRSCNGLIFFLALTSRLQQQRIDKRRPFLFLYVIALPPHIPSVDARGMLEVVDVVVDAEVDFTVLDPTTSASPPDTSATSSSSSSSNSSTASTTNEITTSTTAMTSTSFTDTSTSTITDTTIGTTTTGSTTGAETTTHPATQPTKSTSIVDTMTDSTTHSITRTRRDTTSPNHTSSTKKSFSTRKTSKASATSTSNNSHRSESSTSFAISQIMAHTHSLSTSSSVSMVGILNTQVPDTGHSFASNKGGIIGVSIGSFLALVLLGVLFFVVRRYRQRQKWLEQRMDNASSRRHFHGSPTPSSAQHPEETPYSEGPDFFAAVPPMRMASNPLMAEGTDSAPHVAAISVSTLEQGPDENVLLNPPPSPGGGSPPSSSIGHESETFMSSSFSMEGGRAGLSRRTTNTSEGTHNLARNASTRTHGSSGSSTNKGLLGFLGRGALAATEGTSGSGNSEAALPASGRSRGRKARFGTSSQVRGKASSSQSPSRQPGPGILRFTHQPLPPSTIDSLPSSFGGMFTPETELPEGLFHHPARQSSLLPVPPAPALVHRNSSHTIDSLHDNIDYSRPLSAVVMNRQLLGTQSTLSMATPEMEHERHLEMEDHVHVELHRPHSVAQTPVIERGDPLLATVVEEMRVSPQYMSGGQGSEHGSDDFDERRTIDEKRTDPD